MRKLIPESILKVFLAAVILLPLAQLSLKAQEEMSYLYVEQIQENNEDTLQKIYAITREYPDFSYEYEYENGRLKSVTVSGVDEQLDEKRLESMLMNLRTNLDKIKNKRNRLGVYYSVDEKAKPEGGEEEFRKEMQRQLSYPEDAADWGIEGTLFAMVVVDENGEIPFVTVNEDVETTREGLLKNVEKEVVDAVKSTSGEWEPATVDGTKVPSLVVVPIQFDLEPYPFLPMFIR